MTPNPRNLALAELGQSIWVDNITRAMLDDGTLERYITDYSVTGLTSNPTIFDKAISSGEDYTAQIVELAGAGELPEAIFFELALDDLCRAADLFMPTHERTDGVDGWVSLEVSPLLADDAEATVAQAVELHDRAARDNLLIKIPGTEAGLAAIEEATFRGIPVNVTLLFSKAHYLAQADAWMTGIERRIEAGLDPVVGSVASLFISRWDAAVIDEVPDALRARLGIAIGGEVYAAYRELLDSDRAGRIRDAGGRIQKLLMASTGTKDPEASDVLYVEGLAAPDTVNTMPEATLLAFADHGKVPPPLPADGVESEEVLAAYREDGFDLDALGVRLQEEGKQAFADSWDGLIDSISGRLQTV
ncbi:MAG: transaldolase [Solirubrobacterales bacterium]